MNFVDLFCICYSCGWRDFIKDDCQDCYSTPYLIAILMVLCAMWDFLDFQLAAASYELATNSQQARACPTIQGLLACWKVIKYIIFIILIYILGTILPDCGRYILLKNKKIKIFLYFYYLIHLITFINLITRCNINIQEYSHTYNIHIPMP